MTPVARLVAATLVGVTGLWLVGIGLAQRRPALSKVAAYLARHAPSPSTGPPTSTWERTGRRIYRGRSFPGSVLADLRLVQRPPEAHAAMLVAAGCAGLLAPPFVLAAGQAVGVVDLGVVVPIGVAMVAAGLAPVLVHTAMRARAQALRRDLRHQLSAYLDVVTMLLAGNVGNEGALRQAASAGDGRLFVELRRRILVAETSNRSLVSALAQLGDDLQLIELQQIAASAALGASAGAPVARSLSAKCSTLRSALASEQEAEARVRTGKITVPLVGMSVLIMAAVIYPALNM
jgi:Flp pilus assembly protein TadB